MTSHGELLARLGKLQSGDFPSDARLFPATFRADDPNAVAYPRNHSWRWNSARDVIKHFAASGVMMRLPLWWQLEIPLFEAAREAGACIFVNDAANMPIGAAAIRSADIGIVVTTVGDAAEFSAHLHMSNIDQPAWLIVHALSSKTSDLPPLLRDAKVAQELHLFPGVPLFVQCAALVGERGAFHLADGYEYAMDGENMRVSGTRHDVVALEDFLIPLSLQERRACACGKAVFAT